MRYNNQWITTRILVGLSIVLLSAQLVRAQEPQSGDQPQRRGGFGQMGNMPRLMGEVTFVSGDTLTIKAEDGGTYQVVTTSNTRFMKQGGATFAVADLKPGDGVMSMGNLDAPNKTMHAATLIAISAEQVKQMRQAQANLGKTHITGRVTAIDLDNAKMTIERADGVSQTIGLDENTSFHRGTGRVGGFGMGGMGMRGNGGAQPEGNTNNTPAPPAGAGESITLADIKVGDNVDGPGALKSGVFVPTQLTVVTPRAGGRRQGQGAPSGDPAAGPGAAAPAGTPK